MNSSPIRLIALDLDGTLLDDRKQISRRSLRALRAAADQGVLLVPATGRTVAGIPAELLALPGVRYAITANGARVMDLAENRALSEDYIPRDLALQVYDLLTQYECLVDLFQDGQGYTTEANAAQADRYVPENLRAYVLNSRVRLPDLRAFIAQQERGLEKLTLFFLSEDQRQKAWAKVAALGLEVVSSLPLNMEISAAGVTKGSGLRALAGALDLPAEALMACGDGGNDIPMITAAGLGVAMGNAALIADLNRVKFSLNPYNINRLTLKAGEAALKDTAYFDATRQKIMDTRAWTAKELANRGFSLTDSRSNFLFARTDRMEGGALYRALKEKGILVRHFDSPRIVDYLRITIGTQAQMEALIKALDEILEG